MRALTIGRKMTATIVGSTLALTAFVLAGATARATAPGTNGLIVYQAKVGQHVQLFTVRPDGTRARQVTRFADSDSVHAAWSPDGTRIAFERDFAKHAGIYTMSTAGRHVRSLTPRGFQGLPAYSPPTGRRSCSTVRCPRRTRCG